MEGLMKQCPFCGKYERFDFTPDQIHRYMTEYRDRQKPVQVVFPDLTPEEREFLMTGMCRECQHEVFVY